MNYELYIDIFFLVNFFMDLCVLSVSKKILKCPATKGSICLGALTGAGLTSIMLVLMPSERILDFVICYGIINVLMTKTGLRICWSKKLFQACIVVYMSAIVIGGLLSSLKQYMMSIGIFVIFSIASYWGALGIWNYLSYMAASRKNHCVVLLCNGQKQLEVKAMLDTGNRLRDNLTGKPVSIISPKTASELWQDIPIENLRYIPYHTIGKKNGILPLFTLEKICIYQENELWIANAVVAVAEDDFETDQYDMILNPDIR